MKTLNQRIADFLDTWLAPGTDSLDRQAAEFEIIEIVQESGGTVPSSTVPQVGGI